MRVALTKEDIELLVKLLNDADCGNGFKFVASKQRVLSILKKLGEA
jgi:hypothetical protein